MTDLDPPKGAIADEQQLRLQVVDALARLAANIEALASQVDRIELKLIGIDGHGKYQLQDVVGLVLEQQQKLDELKELTRRKSPARKTHKK